MYTHLVVVDISHPTPQVVHTHHAGSYVDHPRIGLYPPSSTVSLSFVYYLVENLVCVLLLDTNVVPEKKGASVDMIFIARQLTY